MNTYSRFEEVLRFDNNLNIITFEDCRYTNGIRTVERYAYISYNEAKLIAKNLLEGKSYMVASPRYDIPKRTMAFIHVNADKIINGPQG